MTGVTWVRVSLARRWSMRRCPQVVAVAHPAMTYTRRCKSSSLVVAHISIAPHLCSLDTHELMECFSSSGILFFLSFVDTDLSAWIAIWPTCNIRAALSGWLNTERLVIDSKTLPSHELRLTIKYVSFQHLWWWVGYGKLVRTIFQLVGQELSVANGLRCASRGVVT